MDHGTIEFTHEDKRNWTSPTWRNWQIWMSADDEREELASQLTRIVQYVEQLETLDTDAVEPTAQVVAREPHAEREDRVQTRDGSSVAAETVGLFRVPKVIGER